MEEQFRAGADLVERFIVEGAFRSDKPADFAITHLVGRSLAELRWGQYLAGEGYPIQMYSVIRPVSEALNLIDLFVKEPDRAEAWAAGDYRQFQPAAVRKELGIDSDPVYAWMAEHSHPRFAGLQLMTYKIKQEEEDEWQNVLFLGELPLEFGPVLIATTMPGLALLDLALAAGHVSFVRTSPSAGRRCYGGSRSYLRPASRRSGTRPILTTLVSTSSARRCARRLSPPSIEPVRLSGSPKRRGQKTRLRATSNNNEATAESPPDVDGDT